MGRDDYEDRKAERIEYMKTKAQAFKQEASLKWDQATKMQEVIPFGQPILVGHHSEKGDRAYRNRIDKTRDKALELCQKANHYKQKAANAESNRAISSDDPNALEKLREKLAGLEEMQEHMRAANKIVRKKPKNQPTQAKIQELVSMGMTETAALKLFEPDFCNRIGYADYQLQNNNANMRRIKQRIEALEKTETLDYQKIDKDGYSVILNPELNRIQIDFHSKGDYIRLCKDRNISLRSYGFVFSRRDGNVWQRKLTGNAVWQAENIIRLLSHTDKT